MLGISVSVRLRCATSLGFTFPTATFEIKRSKSPMFLRRCDSSKESS